MKISKQYRTTISVIACGLVLAVASGPTRGEIVFNFIYPGPIGSGIGFEDPDQGQARRDALQKAADQWGKLFLHDATIDMTASSFDDLNSDELASAGSEKLDSSGAGFGVGVIRNKILNGVDQNGPAPDGTVDINWGQPWDTSINPDDIDSNQFDFFSTIRHELGHALGFASTISQDGKDLFGTLPDRPGSWNTFDRFVTDGNGIPVIDPNTFALDQNLWDTASIGGTSPDGGLFFNGPNAVEANNGNPVGLFTPNPYVEGSSISHLDDDNPALSGLMMLSALEVGPSTRTLSGVEIGIFKDLGYNVVIPEPSMGALVLVGIVGLLPCRARRF